MLTITEKLPSAKSCNETMTLPFELRQKSRFRAALDDGRDAGVFLPRGGILRHGDCLRAEDGTLIQVLAAPEPVSTAYAANGKALAEAVYHLGNRHVPLQIGDDWLRYGQDHVLDRLVSSLGLSVRPEQAPFEPLGGAYAAHSRESHGYVHVRHG